MATDTIREFLVALGFKADETALKKFERGISQATKAVVTLAAAVETTALAVSIGVARFASNLESLYFASQRTGASATNLKAFDRAARDMGASAGEAQSSIEALARFMRDKPDGAGESILASWFGINTKGANGKILDPVDLALAISKAMQSMPQWQAIMLGGQAGLSENTILAMLNPAFAKNFDNVTDRLKRAGFSKAAADAHRFMEQLRTLGDVLVVLGTRIADSLQDKLGISLKSITDWLDQHSDWIIAQVTHIAGEFIDSFNSIVSWLTQHGPEIQRMIGEAIGQFDKSWKLVKPAMEWLFDKLVDLDKATDGWSTRLLVIGGLLKATGATSIIGGVMSLGSAFVSLASALVGMGTGGALAGLGALAAVLGPLALLAAAGGIGAIIGSAINNIPGVTEWVSRNVIEPIAKAVDFANKGHDAEKKRPAINATRMLMNMGLSPEAAAGLAANFQAESGMDPHAQNGSHYGIGQWDASRQKDFADWAGFDIKDQRADLDKQIHFALYELFHGKEMDAGDMLMNANSAAAAGYAMSHYYERPGLAREDYARASAAQHLSSETTINVHGVTEPTATAKIIANEQERIARLNAEAIREFSSSGQ